MKSLTEYINEERTKFDVLEKIENPFKEDDLISTSHWKGDRLSRHEKIQKEIGKGKCIGSFVVDTGHRNGLEIHNVMDNGIILIQNYNTEKLVTELIARAPQIYRYWNALDERLPKQYNNVISLAKENERLGRNNW